MDGQIGRSRVIDKWMDLHINAYYITLTAEPSHEHTLNRMEIELAMGLTFGARQLMSNPMQ